MIWVAGNIAVGATLFTISGDAATPHSKLLANALKITAS
jgi:hypothetical protein